MCVPMYRADSTVDESISCAKCAEELAALQIRVERKFQVSRHEQDEQ